MALEYDELTMGYTEPTVEEVLAALEARARCVDGILTSLGGGIAAVMNSRSGLDWTGLAALQFSWTADELVGQLRVAASALDESLRASRGAAGTISAGGHG